MYALNTSKLQDIYEYLTWNSKNKKSTYFLEKCISENVLTSERIFIVTCVRKN